jgi:tRNA dimethylallyltransferase
VVLCGPTASGKTALALTLAERFCLEVVSADSRQVYRGMDIGTAKATAAERSRVPHHLLDVVTPDQNFSVADYLTLAREAIAGIDGRQRLPVVVGGTGLYLRALTDGLLDAPGADRHLRQRLLAEEAGTAPGTLYRRLQQVDPVQARQIHPGNLVRLVRALEVWELTGRPLSELQAAHGFSERPYRVLKLGLTFPRDDLLRRIDQRVDAMLGAGLVGEVTALLAGGYRPSLKAMQTIGYREVIEHLAGQWSRDELRAQIIRNTRRYAKRQLTWFRRDNSIIWVDSLRDSARIHSLIDDIISN